MGDIGLFSLFGRFSRLGRISQLGRFSPLCPVFRTAGSGGLARLPPGPNPDSLPFLSPQRLVNYHIGARKYRVMENVIRYDIQQALNVITTPAAPRAVLRVQSASTLAIGVVIVSTTSCSTIWYA